MGSIYKITDGEKCYYGSTRSPLNTRLRQHKKNNDCETKHMDKNNMTIQLLEEVEDKEQLKWRERYYMENNECINKYRPVITDEERKERDSNNRKEHYEKNKEAKKQKFREYQLTHKEQIKQRKERPYECVCGSVVRYNDKAKHFRTKKHLSICGE